jgi:hypothetical protein
MKPGARLVAVAARIDHTGHVAGRAYELMFRDDIPAKAVISEYVDVAHAFYDGDQPGFVNGVLDRVARSLAVPKL